MKFHLASCEFSTSPSRKSAVFRKQLERQISIRLLLGSATGGNSAQQTKKSFILTLANSSFQPVFPSRFRLIRPVEPVFARRVRLKRLRHLKSITSSLDGKLCSSGTFLQITSKLVKLAQLPSPAAVLVFAVQDLNSCLCLLLFLTVARPFGRESGKSRLQQAQEDVEEVKDIMLDNLKKADERSGKLEDLEDRAEQLLAKVGGRSFRLRPSSHLTGL